MNELELILYNVGHGLALSLIERPENYVTQIDLGSDENFSPLEYLLTSRKLRSDVLYITHPHADHLSDISNLDNRHLRPEYITYGNYDWDDVESREQSSNRWIIKKFREVISSIPSGEYQGKANLWWKRWKPEYAKETFGESNYVNNSSLFIVYTWRDFKISITGDIEKYALDKQLGKSDTQENASKTDIYIAPHHGHKSSFTSKWVDILGKPYVSLISIQERDRAFTPEYSNPDFAKGITFSGEKRYCLTTRYDGPILVTMQYDSNGKPTWNFSPEK